MRRSQQPKQFGKQSDPVKPVVKPQQIESTEAQVAPKSLQSGVDSRSNGQPPAKRQKIVQSSTDSIAVDAAKSVAPVAVVTPSLPIPIVSDHSDRTKNHTEADCDVTSIYVTRGTENGYRWDVWELVNRTAEVFAGKVSTDSPGAELECFCLKPNGHGKFSFWFKSVAKGVEISFTIGVHTRNQNDQKGKSFWWKVEHLGQNVVDLNFPCCDDKSCQIGCETNWTRRVCISNLRLTTKTDQKSVEFVKVSRCQDTSEAADAAVTTQQSVKKSDTIQPVIKPEQIQSVEGRDGLRPTSSAVSSGSVGQQPVKQQKMTQSPATVVNLGVNSAAAVVAVSAPPSKLFSGDTRDGAQMVKAETRLSQLEEENLRVTSTLSKMRLTLAEAGKDVAEAESKLSDNTAELLTQLRSNYGQLKLEYKSQVDLAVQLRTQMQLLSETIEKRSKVEENLTSEINRQSIIIDQKSKVEEHHRVQLREKTEEVQRLNGTINQMKIDKAREENQNNRRLGRNVPPYHGWTTDFPDFILISSDDITFPVCRGVLSLKSAVFKADFSTDAAKKDGQVKTAFKADVMLELLKFLCGQDFTENLAVVAVELMRAAEHYQLAELTEVCEEQLVEQLTFDTLIFTIRLADQLSSDLLMAECFKFVKREKGSEKMWEDLHLHLQLPKMMAQITVFSGTGKNAKCPKFHFSP